MLTLPPHLPSLALGVFGIDEERTADVVATAITLGYRAIDTAAIYGNEAAVAEGIRRSGIDRRDLHLTTKLWNDHHGHADAVAACHRSLDALGTDYVDLYLIHWPASRAGRYLEAWGALEELADAGLAHAIGVSNFSAAQLQEVAALGGRTPAVDQIELHPLHPRVEDRAALAVAGVPAQAWSPFARGAVFEHPRLIALAAEHGVGVARLVLAWMLAAGVPAVPRSTDAGRLADNLAALDLVLDQTTIDAIDAIDERRLVEPEYYVHA